MYIEKVKKTDMKLRNLLQSKKHHTKVLVCSINYLKIPKYADKLFYISWKRGKSSGMSDRKCPDDDGYVVYNHKFSCPITLFESKDGSIDSKIVKFSVYTGGYSDSQNEKKKYAVLELDVSQFYANLSSHTSKYQLVSKHSEPSFLDITVSLKPYQKTSNNIRESYTEIIGTLQSESTIQPYDLTTEWDISESHPAASQSPVHEYEYSPSVPSLDNYVGSRPSKVKRARIATNDNRKLDMLDSKLGSRPLPPRILQVRDNQKENNHTTNVKAQTDITSLMETVWKEPVEDLFTATTTAFIRTLFAHRILSNFPIDLLTFNIIVEEINRKIGSYLTINKLSSFQKIYFCALTASAIMNNSEADKNRMKSVLDVLEHHIQTYVDEFQTSEYISFTKYIDIAVRTPKILTNDTKMLGKTIDTIRHPGIKDPALDEMIILKFAEAFDNAVVKAIIQDNSLLKPDNGLLYAELSSILYGELHFPMTRTKDLSHILMLFQALCEQPKEAEVICPSIPPGFVYRVIRDLSILQNSFVNEKKEEFRRYHNIEQVPDMSEFPKLSTFNIIEAAGCVNSDICRSFEFPQQIISQYPHLHI